ncbi:3-hydroxyacyl-CoA dehydrogenase/enoyl-CoA hydratase family protein [Desulfonema magnum]|uniref:3-hydroxyacyl-CoA dehydrogenase n=1 Tax=Desulfonema magnum TaxID=45655 RepID=A0A975BGT3_9BACT|nr:3-hydroxyacyl-CoA dehydrogenase/enoyl-CoA hydratase family protein [Desulfonema magnum]QTA84939.1 3-hydroxyacyl-CoA dehydrogenase [Desulfonema magnum]
MVRKIRKAGVIGSGVMGGGIAALLASAGIKTLLLDIVPFDLNADEKNDPTVRNSIAKAGLSTMIMSQPPLLMDKRDAKRITVGNLEDDIDKLAECDWIIEVVLEHLKIKQELLQKLEKVRKETGIVSTNTSGIPLKKMSEGLSKAFRQHFLGTHFFNPVRYMRLLEIIPGEETRPEILQFMADFGERRLGKGIVWAKDTPNFVGNRIGAHGIVKAMQTMLEDGLTIPEADALFGPVMGRPRTAMFKTCDLVGLDIMAHVSKNTYDLIPDDEQRDSFVIPEFVNRMIEKGFLGKKAESGFYKTEKPGKKVIRKVINPETFEYAEYAKPAFPCLDRAKQAKLLPDKMKAVVYGGDKGAKFAWKVLGSSLIYSANRIPEISDTIVDIDNAMKWGYNFEAGPFETWDAIGVEASVEKMEKHGFEVPEKIRNMLAAGNTCFYKTENGKVFFYDFASESYKEPAISDNVISLNVLRKADKVARKCDSASLIDIGDGVFCCEFHTRMNAINKEIVTFISEVIDYVDANGIGLVIGNQAGGTPGAFSAGGDLFYMGALAQLGKFSEIDAFLKMAQQGIQKAKYSDFPIVAAPYGMTLGGGCEVCIGAADKIVAHAELYMGLVEIGVGLLPSGGGCLNLWKKFINAVPEPVTDYDLGKFFIPVFMNIATAKVSTSAAHARAMGFLGPNDRIVFNRDHLIGEAKKDVLKMADEGYAPPVKKKIKVFGESAQGMANAELFNMLQGKYVTEYDVFLAKRIAYVISGGDVRDNSEIDEEVILKLEREAFTDFWKQKKTHARVEHMLKTGKPLRN